MNDVNQNLIIQNQTRQMLLGGGAAGGMNIAGANSEALEPLYCEGLLSGIQKNLSTGCGTLQMVASLLGIKGFDQTNILQRLETVGVLGQLTAPNVPSMMKIAFEKPNIWGIKTY